jgi:hypothetical protein
MGDESHGHRDVETVLREEAGYVTLTVTGYTGFNAGVLARHEPKESNCKGDHQDADKKLSFHCVVPRKTEADG